MELLVVRHAVAKGRGEFAKTGRDDAERPLTRSGRRKFERGALGLVEIVPSIDLLATSALVRALETCEIVQEAYGIGRAVTLRELEPDARPASLVRWLGKQRRRKVVAVVGHEPHLSRLVEHLLSGTSRGFVELEKGGACLLDMDDRPRAGGAALRWLATAAQLRRLGG